MIFNIIWFLAGLLLLWFINQLLNRRIRTLKDTAENKSLMTIVVYLVIGYDVFKSVIFVLIKIIKDVLNG